MRNLLEKSYLYYSKYTNIVEVKLLCVLHDKVTLLTRRDVLTREQEIAIKEWLYDSETDSY